MLRTPIRTAGEDMWPKIAWNYKFEERRLRGRSKRPWKGLFQTGAGTKLPNP